MLLKDKFEFKPKFYHLELSDLELINERLDLFIYDSIIFLIEFLLQFNNAS